MPDNLHGMKLIGRDGSNDLVKKKSYTTAQRGDELCRLKLGGNQKDSIRLRIDQIDVAAVLPKSEVDICYDQDDCMLMSSNCLFRSSFSSHLSLDEWFNSWLLISKSSYLVGGRGIIFFDGSSINPIEEASLALANTYPDSEKVLSEDLKEEEVFTWLLSSTVNDAVDSSNWISDTESELDSLQSDFPSPFFMSSWDFEGLSPRSSASNDAELGNFSSDDPLFWPFESKFDWSSSDCFSMSPRKDMGKVGYPVGTSPKFLGKVSTKEECNRRLLLSSKSTRSKILEHQHENDKKCVRKSSKAFMKIVPIDMKYDIKEATDVPPKEKLVCTNTNFLEGDFVSNEVQIESLMGLGEFDGHEGVELDFNQDDFFLNESF